MLRRRSPLLPIFLIVLVDVFGLALVIPLLAIYAETFDASAFVASLLVSVFAACQLISGPLLGRASDSVGRRPLLILSQCGTFIGFLVMAWAQTLPMLFLARIIDGASAGNLSLAQAYISDHTEPEDRAHAFGIIGIAFGLGFMVGPSLAGWLAEAYGYRAPIFLAAGLSLLSVLCTTFLLPKGEVKRPLGAPGGSAIKGVFAFREWGGYFTRPVLGPLLVQFLLFAIAFGTFTSGFALFAERRFTWDGKPFGPREIGFLFGYTGVLGAVLQGGLLKRLVRRFGESALVAFGFGASALAYAGLGVVHEVMGLMVVATVAAIGTGLLRPCLTALVTHRASAQEQGSVLGVTQSLVSLASVAAPMLGGALIDHGQLAAWAWVSAAAFLCGLVLVRAGSGAQVVNA